MILAQIDLNHVIKSEDRKCVKETITFFKYTGILYSVVTLGHIIVLFHRIRTMRQEIIHAIVLIVETIIAFFVEVNMVRLFFHI